MTVKRQFKKIAGAKKFLPWKFWEIGDYVQGKLVGKSEDNYGKTNYHVEVEDCSLTSDPGTELDVKPGDTMGLNSNGALDFKMDGVQEGSIIRVTYMGVTELPAKHKFAGKESHQIELEVAEEGGVTPSDLDDVL